MKGHFPLIFSVYLRVSQTRRKKYNPIRTGSQFGKNIHSLSSSFSPSRPTKNDISCIMVHACFPYGGDGMLQHY